MVSTDGDTLKVLSGHPGGNVSEEDRKDATRGRGRGRNEQGEDAAGARGRHRGASAPSQAGEDESLSVVLPLAWLPRGSP